MGLPVYAQFLVVVAVGAFAVMLGNYLARRLRMPDYGWKMGLVLLAVGLGVAITAFGWPPKRGIDLRGGVILVYEVDQEKKASADQAVDMDKLVAAVSRRVNPGGQKEVTVRKFGSEQVEIIVPEADEAELQRLKDILQRVGTLEFRIVGNERDHGALFKLADANSEARNVVDQENNRLAWWVPVHESARDEFLQRAGAKTRVRTVRGEQVLEVLMINDPFDVTGGFLIRAQPDVDQGGKPSVGFTFNSKGGRLFGRLTGANLPDQSGFKRQLGIILDGYLYSAPVINNVIHNQGVIEGRFSKEEVDALVSVLQAGSLPAALSEQPISEMLIGPTLGRDTIQRGSISIVLAMVLVLAFMVVYYRFAGVVACGALLMNVLLVVAIMIMIRAAFTLPGLAGLVLTVGMAVDANVLIFERIREELSRGAALRMAIRNGFSRATTTIVDANITTLITAVILYVVGTDQIRGFAVTLILGVLLSMFTAIFCARVVFDVAEKRRWITSLNMMQVLGGTSIDFLGMRRIASVCSVALILLGMLGVAARGKGLLDIDFTGGVSVEAVFVEPQDPDDVRKVLAELPDLAVTDLRFGGEVMGTRFVVNTSQQDVVDEDTGRVTSYATELVEQHIQSQFGDALATNTLTVADVKTIARAKDAAKPVESSLEALPEEPAVPIEAEPAMPAPAESAPVESAPVESAPVESAPVESAPVESAPAESAPAMPAPAESAPAESAPAESAPATPAEAESAPAESAPAMPAEDDS
ncbi:MAG: protein translocase subunit SecD, partial [Patescibacteria group bacterium]|nr:protein translocase subunit SecD [Patescibacteria group bacterium]